jgi:hypothetical protein
MRKQIVGSIAWHLLPSQYRQALSWTEGQSQPINMLYNQAMSFAEEKSM